MFHGGSSIVTIGFIFIVSGKKVFYDFSLPIPKKCGIMNEKEGRE
jgi:hypothetical protein